MTGMMDFEKNGYDFADFGGHEGPSESPDRLAQDSVEGSTPQPLAGHPRFYELTRAEEQLHSAKNADYAGGGRPMGNFERVAQILSLYPNLPIGEDYVVGLIYMMKQLDAALWLIATGREGKVEGVPERLGDISVYAKLARIMYERSR